MLERAHEAMTFIMRVAMPMLDRCEHDSQLRGWITTTAKDEPPLVNAVDRLSRLVSGMEFAKPTPTTLPPERFFSLCAIAAGALLLTEPERYPQLVRFIRGEQERHGEVH